MTACSLVQRQDDQGHLFAINAFKGPLCFCMLYAAHKQALAIRTSRPVEQPGRPARAGTISCAELV
jgi:hypothetical protein